MKMKKAFNWLINKCNMREKNHSVSKLKQKLIRRNNKKTEKSI